MITKKPVGFYVLLFAAMWERFSYYGVRALLTLYITKQLFLNDSSTYGIYGAYGAMIYSSTVIGGYIADRFIGSRFAIILGSFLAVMGHVTIILPIFLSFIPLDLSFFTGLSFIIIGTGFFKGNIAALTGNLQKKFDICQDSGFTLFHMAANLGSCAAPIICGVIGEKIGWHYGFSFAGLGMTIGCMILYFGRKHIVDQEEEILKLNRDISFIRGIFIAAALIVIPFIVYCFYHLSISTYILNGIGIITASYLVYAALTSPKEEKKCIFALMAIFPFLTTFFACFEQSGSLVNIFTDRHIDREVFGLQIPTSWFLSLNPIIVIILAPLFSKLWIWLMKHQLNPLMPIKLSFGLFQVGLGFLALYLGIHYANEQGVVSIVWIILAYLLHSTGELCLTPVSLAMISKLSPPRLMGFMMSCFYLSVAFAHIVGSGISKTASQFHHNINVEHLKSLYNFSSAFKVFIVLPMIAGLLLLLGYPIYKNFYKRYS